MGFVHQHLSTRLKTYCIYGETFEWENFRGCAQNTLFTGKLLRCIGPWPSCTVYSK